MERSAASGTKLRQRHRRLHTADDALVAALRLGLLQRRGRHLDHFRIRGTDTPVGNYETYAHRDADGLALVDEGASLHRGANALRQRDRPLLIRFTRDHQELFAANAAH